MYHSKGDGNFSSSFDALTVGSTSNIISAEVLISLAVHNFLEKRGLKEEGCNIID